jgi:hypothetical protein
MRALGADPPHFLHFVERFAHADEPYASTGGIKNCVGQPPVELLPELVAHRFLALDAIGLLERGNVVPAFAVFMLGDVLATIGDQAI